MNDCVDDELIIDLSETANINYKNDDKDYWVEKLLEGIIYNLGGNTCKGDAPRIWRCGTYANNMLKPYRSKLRDEFNEQELEILTYRYYDGGKTISQTLDRFPELIQNRNKVKMLDQRLENILTNKRR